MGGFLFLSFYDSLVCVRQSGPLVMDLECNKSPRSWMVGYDSFFFFLFFFSGEKIKSTVRVGKGNKNKIKGPAMLAVFLFYFYQLREGF